ncbi:MAG: TonB family protein [Bdellovibrionaceae bacterium]|nr:TonB family protein [Pseudobdellovibrionaceae bacterium]
MSRFIFYSGLAHCVAFVGVVGYMSTRPKESLPEFLQAKNVPHVEVTTRETVETDVVSGNSARHNIAEDDSTREMRDRKIRANLPAPPETPRVVDKVKDARKLPTTLPAKKGASHIHQEEAPAPETGRDIPLEANTESDVAVAAAPVQEPSDEEQIANEIASAVADEAVSENETPAEDDEKLQIAAFDVDELAESHLQKLKAQEEREHLERMEKLKGEKEAALMAVAAEKEAASQTAGTGEGQNSEGTPSGTEVRALSELRQAPGNKSPQYDVEDRRQGRQGLVVFLAYIKADGLPKEFQLQASSGHRSLDAKTLKALKGWKFQPGQEGWVEIPFQWDLKGGAQEAPSNLRRQGSR